MELIQKSLTGAVLILVIAAARTALLNRLPKKTFVILWCAACFHLLIPVSVPWHGSFYTFLQREGEKVQENSTGLADSRNDAGDGISADTANGREGFDAAHSARIGNADEILSSINRAAQADASDTDGTKRQAFSEIWKDRIRPVLKAIWMFGIPGCLVLFALAYIRCIREFRTSLPVTEPYAQAWLDEHVSLRRIEIRQSDRIRAPLTYGFFHPVILTPKTMDWENADDLKFVLEHEWIHIRRMDVLWKFLLILAVSVHWFNPFVWMMYILMNRDMELSCDEAVVRKFGEESKGSYAMALIRMEEKKGGVMPLGSGFGKNAVEERIGAIMKMKKISAVTGTVAVVLVVGITSVFATTGGGEKLQLEEGSSDEELEAKIEELKEEKEQLLLWQEELDKVESLLTDYGKYVGKELHFSLLDEGGGILYLYDRPVRYLVDEEKEGVRWVDEENGEIAVQVIRDEEGNILRIEEDSAGEAVDGTNGLEESEEETSENIAIIGGADGPTSIFLAGKASTDLNGITEEEYVQIMEAEETITGKGKEKTVKKNYLSQEEIPYAITYGEYTDDRWWGGILKQISSSPLKGTDLYQAVFEGTLYECEW